MKYPRLLVITSCTGEKASKPVNQLTLEDFQAGPDHVIARSLELKPHLRNAIDLYTGAQHLRIVAGLKALREAQGKHFCDLKIISAGFGLIREDFPTPPYEVTFNTMSAREVDRWADDLFIHDDLQEVTDGYDVVIFLLGENYLRAAKLPLESRPEQAFIFLASGKAAERLPQHTAKQAVLALTNSDARSFGYGLVGLKGYLFELMARHLADNPEDLQRWHADPNAAIAFLETLRGRKQARAASEDAQVDESAQPALFDEGVIRFVPLIHRSGLGFNPLGLPTERFFARNRNPLPRDPHVARFTIVVNNRDKLLVGKERRRLWEFLENDSNPPRGFLTSLYYHQRDSHTLPPSTEGNIYDCGAWSWKHELYPRIGKLKLDAPTAVRLFQENCRPNPEDILVSPDLLIMGNEDPPTRRHKIDTTLAIARDFIQLAPPGTRAMAVTHGNRDERREMMRQYLAMGYRHLALGSLALMSSRRPTMVYECVTDALAMREHYPDLYVHVLGVASIKWAATLTRLGVSSFDGSNMYMSAFTAGAMLRYDPTSPDILVKMRVVDNAPWSDELPPCDCPACSVMRSEGWDTRAQGGKRHDPSGRPYNGGNEANMGRAVHNINTYLRALADVQTRVLAGDESLVFARHLSEASRQDAILAFN